MTDQDKLRVAIIRVQYSIANADLVASIAPNHLRAILAASEAWLALQPKRKVTKTRWGVIHVDDDTWCGSFRTQDAATQVYGDDAGYAIFPMTGEYEVTR